MWCLGNPSRTTLLSFLLKPLPKSIRKRGISPITATMGRQQPNPFSRLTPRKAPRNVLSSAPFYYPQVQAILAPGLLLEYLDVRFDELLDELS